MSKSDAMRAMREARYARSTTAVPTRRPVTGPEGAPPAAESSAAPAAPKAAAPRTADPKKAVSKKVASNKVASNEVTSNKVAQTSAGPAIDEPAATGVENCGHKSMNGRACTREAGHPEKSHRYS